MKTVQQRHTEIIEEIAKKHGSSLLVSYVFSNAGVFYLEGTDKSINFQFNQESATFSFCRGNNKVAEFPYLFYADPLGLYQFFKALEKFLFPEKERKMKNKERAQRAETALAGYTGGDPDDLMATVVDLVADILHLAHENHLDANSVLRIAQSHFTEELGEE